MASAGAWSSLPFPLSPTLISALASQNYTAMTPCQAAAITPLMRHQDVSVDAETGSGKTLSFLVPIAQLLLFTPSTLLLAPTPSVRALIILPTRELAAQVCTVATALFATLPGAILPVPLIGGASAAHGPGPTPAHFHDTRLVIATPGRLNAAMAAGTLFVRDLEILIMDEADRLLDMGFSVALTAILSRLPKQRRTGLYSATQTAEVESLARAGLRNPVKVTVRVKSADVGAAGDATAKPARQAVPVSLTCFYAVLRHDHKLHHFTRVLALHAHRKFIVYLLTCASVDFFSRLPWPTLLNGAARPIVALHGKMSQAKRTRALANFARSPNALLVCTDVAARGLDIPDVDWVVQFDPPQDPDAYVHRVGRTARLGRDGQSLVYLAPHEDAYVDFLTVRRCPVDLFVFPEGGDEGAIGASGVCAKPDICASHAEALRKCVLDDRAMLDVAEKAFLSYLRAYKEHRCTYLLQFSNLNIGAVARSFSMLRLPRFQEFKKHRDKLDFEKDTTVRIRDIKYKDKVRERQRQADIKDAVENRVERRDALKEKSKKGKKGKKRKAKDLSKVGDGTTSGRPEKGKSGGTRKEEEDDEVAMREMDEEARMIKKVRRGKLTKEKFDIDTGYDEAPSSDD